MSEDIDKLNQAVRDLNQTLQSLTGNVGNLSDTTARATINTSGLNEVEKARLEAQKKLHEHDLQLKDAAKKAGDSLGNFAKGILDTNVKLTNLNEGLSSAGDAAFALGKAFGPLGMIVGGLVKGFTMLLEANLKISQAYLEGKDQLSKMGGAGAHTTASIQKMAREADLNAETLGRMIKPMQGMGQSIMALGNNAGDAQKNFAKLIKATDEERAMMSRLGINQEQMMQGTADYLALQSASGRGVKNELQDREKLRKASIDYQTSLMDLATLTGKDVDALKAEQKEMLMNRQVQLKNMMDNAKEDRLRREAEKETDVGRKKQLLEQADAIGKESKARNEAFAALAGGPKVLQKGIQELTTGTINGENAQKLARLGMQKDIDAFNKTIREGGNRQEAARKLQDAYIQKFGERVETTGRQMAISGEVAKMYGADSEQELELVSNRRGKSYEEEGKIAEAKRKAAQEAGKDPAADARAALENANIKAAGTVEDLVSTLNPLKLGFVGLAAAAGAAALALGVMAKRGMLSTSTGPGMMDKIKDFLGGARDQVTGGSRAPSISGGAGGIAGSIPGGAGAGQIAEGLGKGPASGKGFLEKAADGLAAFANPKVVVGAGAFGIAIAAVGAGIAGATWIIGKALPSLAEGLTPFEKLDGDKLKSAGAGIAAIGGGMAVFGAGGAAAGIGGIIGGLSEKLGNSMGIDGPFKKLEDFSKLNIDAKKVKENAEAFMAFNKATAAGGAASAVAGAGGLFGGLIDKLSGKLDLKGPLQQLQEFGSVKVNTENVKNNADAMVMFGDAMSKYKGTNESMWGTLTAGVAGFFKQEPPYVKMQNFAKLDLGPDGAKTVKANAQAFVYFSQALAEFKGTSELKNVADNIVGGIVKMFGGDDVMGKFVKFTKLDVDPDRALKLGQAFAAYSSAMNGMTGGGAAATPAPRTAPAAGSRASGAGGGSTAPAGGGSTAPAAPGGGSSGGGGLLAKASSFLGFGGAGAPAPGAGVETDPDASADASADKPKQVTSKPKNVTVSPSADISGVDNTLLTKFYSAAAEYGKPISINSAFRGDQKQAELYVRGRMLGEPGIFMPARPKNDTKINYKGTNYDVPGSGKGSKHREGDALDISGDYGILDPILAKYGLHRPHLPKDPPHVELKAEKGGVASGPKTGYPATLHGNEIIVPIDPQSLLVELGKKSKGDLQTEMASNPTASADAGAESLKELTTINQSMMDMMASKLDAVIDRLEAGNDTQGKLLKYSQA